VETAVVSENSVPQNLIIDQICSHNIRKKIIYSTKNRKMSAANRCRVYT